MSLGPTLELRQSQSLVMTPQLQQAIKLLQLSNIELSAYIEQELERNPLLERESENFSSEESEKPEYGDGHEDAPKLFDEISGQEESNLDLDYDNTFTNNCSSETPQEYSGEFADDYSGSATANTADSATSSSDFSLGAWKTNNGSTNFSNSAPNLEQTVSSEVSLRDFLTNQLNIEVSGQMNRIIGVYIIDSLDETGYLRTNAEEIAESLNCDVERVKNVLDKLKDFEPSGIFAESLEECLTKQLKDKNRFDPIIEKLLNNLELLAKRDFRKLMELCQSDSEELAEMINEIKALDPKPALTFEHVVSQPITPDVLMRKGKNGEWVVELNNETLPYVLINNTYYTTIKKTAKTKETKTFINKQFQSANWLVKAMHQRATTILKVATEIVKLQDNFFSKGIEYLKPLALHDIADIIDMHESTVSRVTSNKYIATPRGIFELKYFFTQAIAGAFGTGTHSAEAVRHKIKAFIEKETVKKVLSDDRIVSMLEEEGVIIARRTVAKYREAMKIPSSVQRRREKKNQLKDM